MFSVVLWGHFHGGNFSNCHYHIFCIFFLFFFFSHLLGKTEEECSFHTLTALFPSRKWTTENTNPPLPWSNADGCPRFLLPNIILQTLCVSSARYSLSWCRHSFCSVFSSPWIWLLCLVVWWMAHPNPCIRQPSMASSVVSLSVVPDNVLVPAHSLLL